MATTDANSTPPLKLYTGADSFGCTLKSALHPFLTSLPNTQLIDLGVDSYYSIASLLARHVAVSPTTTRGLLFCGTGTGVSIFANKYPSVYAAVCSSISSALNSRSINNSNVLCLSSLSTPPNLASQIIQTFLTTPFKSPCPANNNNPWPDDIDSFLSNSLHEMKQIPFPNCAICCLKSQLEFSPVDIMPGAEMRVLRESPTSALVRFKGGSVEPAHHHTYGHDVMVVKGRKKVWNLDRGESYELGAGDYLFTPAGEVHRVKYFEDTEFFIRWDGGWDIFMDEELGVAHGAIDKELGGK